MRVLVIEDDAALRRTYGDLLVELGFDATFAATREEARSAWKPAEFDVVLLDKKLQGQLGPDDGVDLLDEARFSGAKVFLVTAYAEAESIERAFKLGVYDYLEKGPLLFKLLKVKLEQVQVLVRSQQRGTAQGERTIRELWAKLGQGTSQERGRRFEDLMLRVMISIPGFIEAGRNLRNPAEEIDIGIRNESDDPFWSREPAFFLVECKNWSSAVGTAEVAWFADKVRARPAAGLGFFFAPNGFSEPVEEKVRSYRSEGLKLVLVDRGDIDALVADGGGRSERLKQLYAKWALS